MKFTETEITGNRIEFLASAKYLAIPHAFETDTKSGALVEVTDGLGNTKKGICLYDVTVANNPNGSVVVFGIVQTNKLPVKPEPSDEMFGTLVFI